MARIDIVIAKLPALIADRTDSLKVETAIRYIGDIIFDASQDRGGDKAKALAKVLSSRPASPEAAQSREAILTLFRDGYLDRYADYAALKDIALAAGIPSDTAMSPFNQESATVDTPRVVVLTGMLNAPAPSIEAAAGGPDRHVQSVGALKLSVPTPRKSEPTPRPKTAIQATSKQAAGKRVEQEPRVSKEAYGGGLTRVGLGGDVRNRPQGAAATLEITSLDSAGRNAIEFAKKFEATPAGELWARGFPCLLGFVPQISADSSSVEWANPVTSDNFRDHGYRLTSGSPSRLAIRAMLELARADNWTSVAVKGSVRLQAFAEAAAEELELLEARSQERAISDRSSQARTSSVRSKNRRVIRLIGFSASLLVLVELGFGVAYIYSSPEIQARLGVKPLIDFLRWKHEEMLPAKAPENQLEFSAITLELSTRRGIALAPPQSVFKDTDLTNARYLRWIASFKSSLAGVEGLDKKIEARFYDPNGVQIASSDAFLLIEPGQKNANCTGVALMPPMIGQPAGTYKVALYSNDKMITQEGFIVNQDLSAKNAPAVTEAPAPAAATGAQPCTPWHPCGSHPATEVPASAAATYPGGLSALGSPTDSSTSGFPPPPSSGGASSWPPMEFTPLVLANGTITGLPGVASSPEMELALRTSYNGPLRGKLVIHQSGFGTALIEGFVRGDHLQFQVPYGSETYYFEGQRRNDQITGTFESKPSGPRGTWTAQVGSFTNRFSPPSGGGATGTMGTSSMLPGSMLAMPLPRMLGPTLATGTISGLRSGGNPEMNLRLRPQPNGFLHGEIEIRQSGFGTTSIEGFVRGDHLQFQVPYGTETYYFEGERRSDQISGTFESTPSGERGTWNTRAN